MKKNSFKYILLLTMTLLLGLLVSCVETDPTVNFSQLEAVLNTHEQRVESDYTEESWSAYITVYTEASSLLNNDDATQSQVNKAVTNLNNAISALVLVDGGDPVNKETLETLVTTALAKVEDDYTEESWTTFIAALESAQLVILDEEATQSEITNAISLLTDKMDALVLKVETVNKTALQTAVTNASSKTEDEYLEEDWALLQSKLSEAEALLLNDDATQIEVDDLTDELNLAINKAHGITWTYPSETFYLTHDIIKYRNDRENDVFALLTSLVKASLNGENTQVIADSDSLPETNQDGTYPLGEWSVTYKAMGLNNILVTTTYTFNIVDGHDIDYYFLGVTSEDYATPSTQGGNQNWNGGTGIRVAENLFFRLINDITELPENLLYEGKLKDFDDPVAIQNLTGNDITFKVNETTGVHIHMNAEGRVLMMYEGIQNDYWTVDGKSKVTPSNFGQTNITIKNGDIYLVVGYTAEGNYYSYTSATEQHWKDGRFVARNTLGGATRPTASNIVKVVKGDNLITAPYVNQAPYLSSDSSNLVFNENTPIPTKAQLLEGLAFKDDNGVWSRNDILVSAENISIEHNIDMGTVGTYQVTYTVTDGEKTLVYIKNLEVIEVVGSDFISYTNASGENVLYRDASDVTYYNQKSPSVTGTISIYDSVYFNENKDDSTKFSPSNFGVYVLVGANGEFVESYFNTNLISSENVWGATVPGSKSDATLQALETLTLSPGQYIMFFQQDAGEQKVRTFAVGLRDSFKNRVSETRIEINGVKDLSNLTYLSYINKSNEVISYDWVTDVLYYNKKSPSATGTISIYDSVYFNENKEDSTKFSPSNFGVYVLVGKNGEFVESYFNTNLISSENVWGVTVPNSKSDATLQALETLTLSPGQYILFFQQNAGEHAVRDFAVGLRDSYKDRIGQRKIAINAFGIYNYSSISYTANNTVQALNVRNYLFNPNTYNALNADITIYDNSFNGSMSFGFGVYLRLDANGVITELYDGANGKVYNSDNPSGVGAPAANILSDFDFTTLEEGELIIILPNNSHTAAGDDKPLTSTYGLNIRAHVQGETFNANNVSIKLTYIYK